MARIRSIKPEYWTDPVIVSLPFEVRLFYIGLWNFADDYGCVDHEPARLKLQILPADQVDAESLVAALVDAGRLRQYVTADGTAFLHICSWERHQKVDKRSAPRFGAPETWSESSGGLGGTRGDSPTPTEVTPAEGNGREGKGSNTTRDDEAVAEARPGASISPAAESDAEDAADGRIEPGESDADDPGATEFAEFWRVYPARNGRKVGKGASRLAFGRLSAAQRARAITGARNLAASERFPKDPERFLRRDRSGSYPFDDWQSPAQPDGNVVHFQTGGRGQVVG